MLAAGISASSGSLYICQLVSNGRLAGFHQLHRAVHALAIMHTRAEVHAAHRFHQQIQRVRLRALRQFDLVLRDASVHRAHFFAIEKNKTEIMNLARLKRHSGAGRYGRAVKNAAVALIVILHVARFGVLDRLGQIRE